MDASEIDRILSTSNEVAQNVSANAASILVDVGNLLAFNPRPADSAEMRRDLDDYLLDECQQSAQMIINKLFALPVERVDDVVIAKLPKGIVVLPREKSLPKPKPETKWEKYAKMKGIKKTKKPRKIFDEAKQEWLPSYGYKRAKETTKDWVVEVKANEKDPNQDFFAKRTEAKNERKSKNELQRLRNIGREIKRKVPGVGNQPHAVPDKNDKLQLRKALNMANTADASMSKFSAKIKDSEKLTKGFGKKRKFVSNSSDLKSEHAMQLKVFDRMTSNRDKSNKEKLNISKAANKQIADEDNAQAAEGRGKKGKKGQGKGKRRSDAGKHRRVGGKTKGGRTGGRKS